MSSTLHSEEIAKKKKIADALAKQIKLRKGLPHLYGWKWYAWARDFFESKNKTNLLCAANQISKSSTQIRKSIDWATNKELWPSLWRKSPSQFWYFYPTQGVASVEFEEKWKQFLPSGEYKDDPVYGWVEDWKKSEIFAIHFKSGVSIYFKSYEQKSANLQTGTIDAIFCDEELPMEDYDELMFRLSASEGYFHMVFTATLGQDFWRRALDPEAFEDEALPGAWKREISMYDCQYYEDGTPSHWTDEKIQNVKNRCQNHKEVLRRVYGKFVRDDQGMKYEQFDLQRHMVAPVGIPHDWYIYGGVDIGSGDEGNHPAAICFVAVRPDYQRGQVFIGWRGDGILTTAGDVMTKFQAMRAEHKLKITEQRHDWGSKDFTTIAERLGEPFIKAEKSHKIGEEIINVLFKNNLLVIHDTEELRKLAAELINLRKGVIKRHAKDDLADAMRYALTAVPWDFNAITSENLGKPDTYGTPDKPLTEQEREINARREFIGSEAKQNEDLWDPDSEIADWNEAYGNGN